jgi:hypothetical protein
MDVTKSDMKTKLIFNSYLAKQLLNRGNPIIDLLKNHSYNNMVVFVFEDTEKFNKDMSELLQVLKHK